MCNRPGGGGSFSLCDNDYDYDIAAEWVLDSFCMTGTVTPLIQFKSSKLIKVIDIYKHTYNSTLTSHPNEFNDSKGIPSNLG